MKWGAGEAVGDAVSDKTGLYLSSTVFEATPELDIEDTEYGYHYAALRDGRRPRMARRLGAFGSRRSCCPPGRIIPANAFQFYLFEVPMDDVTTATYIIFHGQEPQDRPC